MIDAVPPVPSSLESTICSPGAYCEKSITRSIRSAGWNGIRVRATGRWSRPPSPAICVIARPRPSLSVYERALDAFRKRRRYLRRCTRMRGEIAPLARIVSPRKPTSTFSAYLNEPSRLNAWSPITIGTSYSPCGRPSSVSRSSSSTYIAFNP